MNRADRRRQAKQAKPIKRPAYHGLSADRKKEQLFRNGITADDLDKEYRAGYDAGVTAMRDFLYPCCFAAAALALRELYNGKSRFGRRRIQRFLGLMDDKISNALTSREVIDEVFREIGIKMTFGFAGEEEDDV